jgi:hypothetical protein
MNRGRNPESEGREMRISNGSGRSETRAFGMEVSTFTRHSSLKYLLVFEGMKSRLSTQNQL